MRFSTRKRASKASTFAIFASAAVLTSSGIISIFANGKANAETVMTANGTTKLTEDRTYANSEMAKIYNGNFDGLGAFHIIAFNDFDQTQQAYGNIAVNRLSGQGNNVGHFDIPTISYVKEVSPNAQQIKSFQAADGSASESSVLVVGANANVKGKASQNSADGFGDLWTINGADVNSPKRKSSENSTDYFDNVWQEDAELGVEYLDFNTLKAKAIDFNQYFSSLDDTVTDHNFTSTGDVNRRYVHAPESNAFNTLTVDKSYLGTGAQEIEVNGFNQNKGGLLVLNVDLAGETDWTLDDGFRTCYNTSDPSLFNSEFDNIMEGATGSRESQFKGGEQYQVKCLNYKKTYYQYPNHTIINIYDSSDPDGLYRGKITTNKGTSSSIIAPEATIHIKVDGFQGIAIANNIELDGDSYFLSLSDDVPFPNLNDCTLTIIHKNYDTGEIIDNHVYEYVNICADNLEYSVDTLDEILDQGFFFHSGSYEGPNTDIFRGESTPSAQLSNGASYSKTDLPFSAINDSEDGKTFILYYTMDTGIDEAPETGDNLPILIASALGTIAIFGFALTATRRR